MDQELNSLAENFIQYRRDNSHKKRVKFPRSLWDRAIEICKRFPAIKVAKALQIDIQTLQHHLKSTKQAGPPATFIPIQIAHPHPPIQLHIKYPLPMTIDFNRSTEELAKLILTSQEGLTC